MHKCKSLKEKHQSNNEYLIPNIEFGKTVISLNRELEIIEHRASNIEPREGVGEHCKCVEG